MFCVVWRETVASGLWIKISFIFWIKDFGVHKVTKIYSETHSSKIKAFDKSEELNSSWLDNGDIDIDNVLLVLLESGTIHGI